MDAAGPRRSAKERPDVRLSASRSGQSALLETVTAGQPGAVSVHGFFNTVAPDRDQLQPPILLDGLFEKRTGWLRAVHAQKATTDHHHGQWLPLPGAQNPTTHAHTTAVPEAHTDADHYRRADGHVTGYR